jgi:hypothetical protein
MLLYSHIWDGLLKLVSLIGFILLAVFLKLDQHIPSVPLMIGIVAVIWAIVYRQWLSILSSWLYARMGLRTNLSFNEAKTLRKLFQLDVSGKWVPVRDIKKLPDNERHDAVLEALQRFGAGRKAMLL